MPDPLKTPLLIRLVLLCAIFLLAPGHLFADAPQVIHSSDPDRPFPVWVSAEAAFQPSGEITESLFSPGARIVLEGLLHSGTPGECIQVEESYVSWVNPPDLSSLDKVMDKAALQLQVRVIDRDWGFGYGGTPGQLLSLEPLQAFRGRTLRDRYFIFLPVGNFTAGPASFCKTDRRFARPPEIGEDGLLLLPEPVDLSEELLDLWFPESFITLHRDGSLSLPQALRSSEPALSSRDTLLKRLSPCKNQEPRQ